MTIADWLRSEIGPAPQIDGPLRSEPRVSADGHAFFVQYLKPGMRALHIGCGDGRETVKLLDCVPGGKVVGLDDDSAAIRAARRRVAWREDDAITFETGPLTSLPFESDSFESIYISSLLNEMPEPAAALAEIMRVLRPGGALGARHTVASSRVMTIESPDIAEGLARLDAVRRDMGGDPDFGLRQPGLMRAAGLINLRVTTSTDQALEEDLLEELEARGLVRRPEPQRALDEEGPEVEDSRPTGLFSAVIAVETVGWKPTR
jgi:SAM-dependent methyltransferase